MIQPLQIEWFFNVFNILFFIIALCIGIILGILFLRYGLKPKNQILYCRERDGRGMELNVNKEDAVSLETKSSPELRFYKYGRSYEFKRRGRAFTRFFGKEGTAYSWKLQGFSKVASKFKEILRKIPMLNDQGQAILNEKNEQVFEEVKEKIPIEWKDQSIEMEFPTLEEAVRHRWGEKDYGEVPERMKALLRDEKVLVTVNLEPGIVPEGYEPITESVIKKKANEDMAELMAHSLKGAVKKTMLDVIPWIGLGAAGLAVASKLLGWW